LLTLSLLNLSLLSLSLLTLSLLSLSFLALILLKLSVAEIELARSKLAGSEVLLTPSSLSPSLTESELWMQMVLNLSQAQVQDLLFLRRLNLTRRCTLSTERKALLHQMAASEAEALDHRSDNLQAVSLMATQLQKNAAEDRQVYYKLARALYRGVSAST